MNGAAKKLAPTRHGPVAYGRAADGARHAKDVANETPSETRLQAAVGRESGVDERELYADVPCTD